MNSFCVGCESHTVSFCKKNQRLETLITGPKSHSKRQSELSLSLCVHSLCLDQSLAFAVTSVVSL